jgi:hypothetical protein
VLIFEVHNGMCTTISSLVSRECGTSTMAGFEVQYITYTGLWLGSEKNVH